MPDINDAVQAGVKLQHLKEAADLEPPVQVLDAARGAKLGLERMESLRLAVSQAQDVASQVSLVLEAGRDSEFVHACAYAYMHKKADLQGVLAGIQGLPRLGPQSKMLEKIIAQKASEIRNADEPASTEGRPMGGLLSELGAEGMRSPPGYEVSRDGIWKSGTKLCATPMVVLRRAKDMDTDESLFEIAWLQDGEWETSWVKGLVLADHKRLLALAEHTHSVNSVNSLELVGYFAAFIDENKLETAPSLSRLGWAGGPASFVLGNRVIGKPVAVSFVNNDGKAEAKKYSEAGDIDVWFDAVKMIEKDPLPMVFIYAALASTLLYPLKLSGFLIDLWCESRHGKTAILKLAASVWAPPLEDTGIVRKWAGKRTPLQEQAWFNQNLPLLLDETSVAYDGVLKQACYELPDGQGSSRGKPDGTKHPVKTWRLITLSTGEFSALAEDARQGALNRIISINRAPFGPQRDETRVMLDTLTETLLENHGLLGPLFIEAVQRMGWETLRKRFLAMRQEALPHVGIKSDYVAVLILAGRIAHEIGLPGAVGPQTEFLYAACRESQRDMPKEAAVAALSWATGNEAKFYGRIPTGGYEPHGGWLGWWSPHTDWTHIDFRPHALRAHLKREGYEYQAALAVWRARGWIDLTARGSLPRMQGTEVVRLKRFALEALADSAK